MYLGRPCYGYAESATYIFKDKHIEESESFTEQFLNNRQKYLQALEKYNRLKQTHNKNIHMILANKYRHNIASWRFNNNIKQKFSHIIYTQRNDKIVSELNNEDLRQAYTIHNFTNLTFNSSIYSILNKGPKFIPTQPSTSQSSSAHLKEHVLEAVKNYSSYITGTHNTSVKSNTLLNLNLHHPNFNNSSRDYIINVLDKCKEYEDMPFIDGIRNSNITDLDHKRIKSLAQNPNIIINTADKNLGISINSTGWYVQEYVRQLNDTRLYKHMAYENIEKIKNEGIHNLKRLHDKYSEYEELNCYNLQILTQRDINDIQIPTLNITPKVHKLKETASEMNEKQLKGRPIVNGFATLNTEPSRLLGKIFHDCLNKCIDKAMTMDIRSPIVTGSRDVVNKLNTIPFHHYDLDQIFFITFDFSSLYTSIKKWTVFNTIHFLGAFLKLDKQLINLMKDLFNFIKDNAYFTVGNCMLYLQQEGFAMGSYDSMDGANLVLFKSEFYILQNKNIKNHIVDFYRFIDDGSLILHIVLEDIKSFLEEFASYYPKELEIEFKVSKFQAYFLDLSFGIGYNTYTEGKCYYRVYQKPFNTYSYTNFSSNHPPGVFKGIVTTECHRYRYLSCVEKEYDHMVELFSHRLMKCGFPKQFIHKHMLKFKDGDSHVTDQKLCKNIKKEHNFRLLCKWTFDNTYKQYNVLRHILRNKYKHTERIKICNRTGKKLNTLFLTKKVLHNKLERYFKEHTH